MVIASLAIGNWVFFCYIDSMPIEGLPKKYIIAAAAAVFVVLAAVFMAQLKPVDATAVTTETFSVQSGDGFSKIANNLSAQGFIRSRVAFEFFLFADGTASSLRPGILSIEPGHVRARDRAHACDGRCAGHRG